MSSSSSDTEISPDSLFASLSQVDREFMKGVLPDMEHFMAPMEDVISTQQSIDLMGHLLDIIVRARHHLMTGMVAPVTSWPNVRLALRLAGMDDVIPSELARTVYGATMSASHITKVERTCMQWVVEGTLERITGKTLVHEGEPTSLGKIITALRDTDLSQLHMKMMKKYYGMVDNLFHRMVRDDHARVAEPVMSPAELDTDPMEQKFMASVRTDIDRFMEERAGANLSDQKLMHIRMYLINTVVRAREHLMSGLGVPIREWKDALVGLLPPLETVPTSSISKKYRALATQADLTGSEKCCLEWALMHTLIQISRLQPEDMHIVTDGTTKLSPLGHRINYLTGMVEHNARVVKLAEDYYGMRDNVFRRMLGHRPKPEE